MIGKLCTVPPEGWYCTRISGHEGPCAALPVVNIENPDDVVSMFSVTKKQSEQAKIWRQTHDEKKHSKEFKHNQRYSGAIGGAYTWQFTGTSLGEIVSIRCSCGDEINLTDWSDF